MSTNWRRSREGDELQPLLDGAGGDAPARLRLDAGRGIAGVHLTQERGQALPARFQCCSS